MYVCVFDETAVLDKAEGSCLGGEQCVCVWWKTEGGRVGVLIGVGAKWPGRGGGAVEG